MTHYGIMTSELGVAHTFNPALRGEASGPLTNESRLDLSSEF